MINTPHIKNELLKHSNSAELANALINDAGVRTHGSRNRGRGAGLNMPSRFNTQTREDFDDGWETLEALEPFSTTTQIEKPRTIISKNSSPDLPFDRSINPYRGCEHGCIYCFARPTHSYMGLSAGLDFESSLFVKPTAAALLKKELAKANYSPRIIAIGTNTDPYQPIEKKWRIMRQLLEVFNEANHPVAIVTKSALILRDLDILKAMASKGLVRVGVSLTTLDNRLSRLMEPRASAPHKRLSTIEQLNEASIPTIGMIAPIIPGLNDHEIERLIDSADKAGVISATYVLLRLPREVSPLFRDWLLRHYPDRYRHVMSLIRSMRDGKDYDADFTKRMRGKGPYAWQIQRRFELARKKHKLNRRLPPLRTDLFIKPAKNGAQLSLF